MITSKFRLHSSGFTIVEMILVTIIFAMMSVAAISVYIQTTEVSHKLEMTRFLSESAREITERIASDIRERGIDITSLKFNAGMTYEPFDNHIYTNSGGEVLAIGGGRKYIYGKKTGTGILPCRLLDRVNPKENCGIYMLEPGDTTGVNAFNLVDSFIPDESKKRVKVRSCTFFVSGNETTEKKVTMIITLTLANASGVKGDYLSNSDFTIQTTISERGFRKY